jgi:hypothetical protein
MARTRHTPFAIGARPCLLRTSQLEGCAAAAALPWFASGRIRLKGAASPSVASRLDLMIPGAPLKLLY